MGLQGEISVPGDKSISHRALMFSALSDGSCRLENLNPGADVISTREALRHCGIHIEARNGVIHLQGGGLRPFKQPDHALNCGNSGTTARLMMGLLAAHPFHIQFMGDPSLSQRPMDRVFRPLMQMGANVSAREDKYLPVMLSGRELWALDYSLPYASAQVKSAILLAGLHAHGKTTVNSPAFSRDHSEQMLRAMGATLRIKGRSVSINPLKKPLAAIDMCIPGDFSAAAFFIAAALLVPGSDLIIRNVGVNPTRIGFLEVAQEMGGRITRANLREENGEATADLRIETSALKAVEIHPERIANLIDELPLVALLASQAEGETLVRGAEELRFKESDRIKAIVTNMNNWGVRIFEHHDGFNIEGPAKLKGGAVKTYNDHRIAMTMSVAGLISKDAVKLDNPGCVDISHPGFFEELRGLSH